MIRLLAIILLFQLPFQLVAQDSIFKSITATQVDNGMLISFTIRGGVTCSGVRIERSSDNNLFTEIHEIIGVCGAISTDESYSFTDENPIPNQESYYRLDMGTLGIYSEIVAVKFIDYKNSGLVIFPNPCQSNCAVYFTNSSENLYDFRVFNRIGQIVLETSVSNDKWIFPATDFIAGFYFIKIYHQYEEKYSGKLVIP